MKEKNFSVLMSVYKNDNPKYLEKAIESCIVCQEIKPNEIILVQDGQLPEDLDSTISRLMDNYPIIKTVKIKENKGLGNALKEGIKYCSNNIVARMDSDDICIPNRFARQLPFMDNFDVVGMGIEEFYDYVHDKNIVKIMPESHKDIFSYALKRNPINHMTVMFNKNSVMECGSYESLPFVEDYYLWVRMLINGKLFYNIPEVGVYARTGRNMYKRRSNKETISSWKTIQNLLYKHKYITFFNKIMNMISITIFTYMPVFLKEFVYMKVFRNKYIDSF